MRRWTACRTLGPVGRAGFVGALALAALAGCSAAGTIFDDPVIEAVEGLEGGECFAAGERGGFDITQEVPCTAEHTWEVLATVPLPDAYADAEYDDLVDEGNALTDEVFHAGMRACVPEVARWSGLADRLDGVAPFGADALVWPGVSGTVLISLTPERVWADAHALLCIVEWTDLRGEPTPVTSASEAPAIAAFTAGTAPELRVCRALDAGGGYHPVTCADPHDAEFLFTYDAAVHGADWVAGVAPEALTPEDWTVLDGACRAAADAVFGGARTQPDLAIIADVAPDTWGAGPLGPETYAVACMALPSDPEMLLDGPVWDLGDAPATLVPAAGA